MKTVHNLIPVAVVAAAVMAFAPGSTTAQPAADGGKVPIGYLPAEYLVTRSDVIADLGLKVSANAQPRAVLNSLTAEQKARLDQIALQMQGVGALRSPAVQKDLKLSAEQAAEFERLAEENMAKFDEILESDLDDAVKSARFSTQREKNIGDVLAVLTDAQRAQWKAMKGASFAVDRELGMAVFATPDGAVPPQPQKAIPPLLAAGTPAPDFEARTVDGKTVRLSDYRGKVVVLDFWATWCGPCIASLPNLEETARRAQGQEVVFLALNVWDKELAFRKWLGVNSGLTLQFARDPAGESRETGIASLYNVAGIPVTYVIDREGRIAGTPKSEVPSMTSGGGSKPIRTTGTPDKALVELLGKHGIRVM